MSNSVEVCPCCKRHVPIGGPPFVVGNPCTCCNGDPAARTLASLLSDATAEFMRTVRVACAVDATNVAALLAAHSDLRQALTALDGITR